MILFRRMISFYLMGRITPVSGKFQPIKCTDKAKKHFKMVQFSKVSGKKAKLLAKEGLYRQTEIHMMENGKIINLMDLEYLSKLMAKFTKGIG